MTKLINKLLLISILIVFCFTCRYKAGNRVTLDYVIDTKLDHDVIKMYMDTLILKKGFQIPRSWTGYNKLVDLIPESTRRIFFQKNPKEMYLIQFNGVLLIADVYNPLISESDYIGRKELLTLKDELRIRERFKREVLDSIERMAKRNGMSDTVLYFHPAW